MKKATVKKLCAIVIEEVCDEFMSKAIWKICWDYAKECLVDPDTPFDDIIEGLRNGQHPSVYFNTTGLEIYESFAKLQDKIDALA